MFKYNGGISHMVIMAKLKTKLLADTSTSMAAAATLSETVEYIAEEDMKIVGCAFGMINAAKTLTHATLARSGNQRTLYEYNTPRVIQDTDQAMFGTRLSNPDPSDEMPYCSWELMLPSGEYFDVEEGERFYFHTHKKNNDTSSHVMLTQALVYYK